MNGNLSVIYSIFFKNNALNGGAILNNGYLKVDKSSFTGNKANDGDGGAIYNDGTLTASGSTFIGNIATSIVGHGGGAIYNFGTGSVRFNRIIGNNNYDIYNAGSSSLNMLYNWWGTNFVGTNPLNAGRIHGGTATSWIVLKISASPTTIKLGGSSTVTANLLHDNKGVYHSPAAGMVPYISMANFKTSLGTIVDSKFSNGVAKSTLKGGSKAGVAIVSTKVDNMTISTKITV